MMRVSVNIFGITVENIFKKANKKLLIIVKGKGKAF
jgi:hypothetical protein